MILKPVWTIVFILFFLTGSFSQLALAQNSSDLQFSVFLVEGEKQTPIDVGSARGKLAWEKVAEGVEAIKGKMAFTLPESIKIQSASSASSSADIKFKGQRVLLVTADLNTVIDIEQAGGPTVKILVKIKSTDWPLWVTGCEELGLKFKSSKSPLPFFVGVRCLNDKSSGLTKLQMSFPEELQLENSNLVESAGKGESWRSYDLGNLDAAQGLIARFKVRFQKQSYALGLASTKIQAPLKKPVESKFALGIGYDMMKFDSPLATVSDANPLFLAKALPYKLFWILGAGIDLAATLNTKQSENSISYFQVSPYAQLRLFTTDAFTLDPRVYYSLTKQGHAFSSASFQVNQAGVGLKIGFQVTDGLLGQFEYRTDSIGSEVIKSHYLVDLGLRQKSLPEKLAWGGGVQMQSITVISSPAVEYQFSNMAVYGLVIF